MSVPHSFNNQSPSIVQDPGPNRVSRADLSPSIDPNSPTRPQRRLDPFHMLAIPDYSLPSYHIELLQKALRYFHDIYDEGEFVSRKLLVITKETTRLEIHTEFIKLLTKSSGGKPLAVDSIGWAALYLLKCSHTLMNTAGLRLWQAMQANIESGPELWKGCSI